jgi:C-terminal processing protease CtpA/Prc
MEHAPLPPHRAAVERAFLALVRDSLVPSDPRHIADIAFRAAAAERSTPHLPADFGDDLEAAARALAELLPGPGPWWDVIAAMAWESDTPHTGFAPLAFRQGLHALHSGRPRVDPGLALWRQADGRVAAADVHPLGSAAAAGLRNGDVIETLAGRRAARLSAVLGLYAGEPGSRVRVTGERAGTRFDVDLELRPGNVPPVDATLLAGGVALLRIRWFASVEGGAGDSGSAGGIGSAGDTGVVGDTGVAARRALASALDAGVRGLVLDLRSGIGGTPDAMLEVTSALVAGDPLVVIEHDGQTIVEERTGPLLWHGGPIAVLVNEGTMSSAEYLALALEEYAGAVRVGTPTGGGLNGISFIDLGDGYAFAIPRGRALGPVTRAARAGHRLDVHIAVPNPTHEQLAAGIDPPLERAHAWVLGRLDRA